MEPKQRQFSIRYSIIAIAALLLIEGYLFAPRPETLAYSDFVKLVQAGKVSDALLLRGGRVLDVGCGWGGALHRLVTSDGARAAVGLTMSRAQFDWATARSHCRSAWLRGRLLSTGSLSLGINGAHFELVVPPHEADELAHHLEDAGFPASRRMRRGRVVLTWGERRTRNGMPWAAAHVATVSADDSYATQVVSGPLRDADSVAPVILENGAPGVAWSDNGSDGGRLHLAAEGTAAAPRPGVQVRVGKPERTAVRRTQLLVIPVTCSAACDLRGYNRLVVLLKGTYEGQVRFLGAVDEPLATAHWFALGLLPADGGADAASFDRAAQEAERNCPVSRALQGNVEIGVQATLDEHPGSSGVGAA